MRQVWDNATIGCAGYSGGWKQGGRLAKRTDATGDTYYAYNELGKLMAENVVLPGSSSCDPQHQREFWQAMANGCLGRADWESVLNEDFWSAPQKSPCWTFLAVAREQPELVLRLSGPELAADRELDEFCAGELSQDESAALLSGHVP